MKRKNNVIYINGSTLKNMANYGLAAIKGWLKVGLNVNMKDGLSGFWIRGA